MLYSYRIKNGRVIDPAANIDSVCDIVIRNSQIAQTPKGDLEAEETIDATGCLVFPGLIDFHAHLYHRHSDYGIHPDLINLPNGVTAAVDAGSAGSSNFEGFYKDVVCRSDITMKSYVNISGPGLATGCFPENLDPAFYDLERLEYLFERYRENILGIKIRTGSFLNHKFGLVPLKEACKVARKLNTHVCVHVTHLESSYEEIAPLLEQGDVLCHCFQNNDDNNTIFDNEGKIRRVIKEARKRGVIFDIAYGRKNHSFHIARQALAESFLPDVISSDLVTLSTYKPTVFSLPYIMTAYLALGVPLKEVVRRVTETPARLMELSQSIGSLKPGFLADVAIFKLIDQNLTITDYLGDSVQSNSLLVPQMTFKAGRMAYASTQFYFHQ